VGIQTPPGVCCLPTVLADTSAVVTKRRSGPRSVVPEVVEG
jgi:hypothetical protein